MPNLDDYIHITEAAKYLGVCINTLRNWEADGKLRVHRNPMNGYRLYKVSDLDSLLRQVQQSGTKPKRKPR
jgi:MerR family transcriptional regulator, copper efflux regulator